MMDIISSRLYESEDLVCLHKNYKDYSESLIKKIIHTNVFKSNPEIVIEGIKKIPYIL